MLLVGFKLWNEFSSLFIRDILVRLIGAKFKEQDPVAPQSFNLRRVYSCDFTDAGNLDTSKIEVHISQN